MRKLVLLIAALLVAVAMFQNGLSVRNGMGAVGLLIFSLCASTYFMAWPVSRTEQGGRRFNADFLWFLVYLGLASLGGVWFYLLVRV